jgi:hypothetical protein
MKIKVVILFTIQCLLLACGEKTTEEVYVKDDLYSQSLTIGISKK